MTPGDTDILDCVNRLGADDRNRLIEFIGFREVNEAEVHAAIASHAQEKKEVARN